jgi:hypothetical protein
MNVLCNQETLIIQDQVNFKDAQKNSFFYTLIEFVENFTYNNVYVDPTIQTKERWKNGDYESFMYTIETNTCDDKIIICEIESCLIKAIKDQNTRDFEKLLQLKNRGYKYISLDGNHRAQKIWQHKDEINKYPHQKIEILVYKYLSVYEMRHYAYRKNLQKSWNDTEIRNSLPSAVGDFVREISNEFMETTNKLNVKTERYRNHKYIACLLQSLLWKYQGKPGKQITQSDLNKLYTLPISDEFFERFRLVLELWSEIVITIMTQSKKKTRQMFIVTLFMICDYLLTNKKDYINKEYLEQIGKKFVILVNEIEKEYKRNAWWNSFFDLTRRESYSYLIERQDYFIDLLQLD